MNARTPLIALTLLALTLAACAPAARATPIAQSARETAAPQAVVTQVVAGPPAT